MAGGSQTAVVVRRSREADAEDWLGLLSAVAAEGLWIGTEAPFDREARRTRFLQQLDAEGAASFVAVADGRLMGALGVMMGSGVEAGVAAFGMFVAADHRGRGVGSALMEACLDWAKAAGAHKVVLTVWPHNHAARALYAKFGFVTEGTLRRAYRRRNGELWDAITMGLVLDRASPGRRAGGGRTAPPAAWLRPLRLPGGHLRRGGLILRPGRLPDAEALVTAIDDAEVHRWLDELPDPYTLDHAHAFLADSRQQWTEGTAAPFVITREDRLVGGIGLSLDAAKTGLGEVGYWVARQARGQGVATTALAAVVEWAFGVVGVRCIELHAAVENTASRRVAERAGFQQEGIKRARLLHGVPTDYVLYTRLSVAPGHDMAPAAGG
ncbi:MAG: GNAT family N-acetyltransferase [Acidimicrobiales bacterium]|nr:GNAT family N-acetyltransferase [Acidimicrobiales bacterium]